ncbi:trigger factor [Amaricoccus solimangrovi]|uniref:Trigger factor n=1 Tax=Amaricoccus solimangrovi TaxID=2589815 RepID=A0A501WM38_9RHOB|nr:trigger factor [Amaricoccus solimangrovi]TPE49234.1 trigger factor [Amaricoccus solimangrovi]
MQVVETLNEGLKREYSITVPAGELEAKVNEKLEEARKDFQMKGFRKGKAPAALMKKMFGKSVLGEAMQETIDAAMREHFEQTGDRPAVQPEVKVTNEDWEEGQDVQVSMAYQKLPAVPEVALAEIRLERLVAEIDEASVDEALGNLANSATSFEAAPEGTAAESGDQVVFDFKGSVDGVEFDGGSAEDFPLVLGSGSFIPGFEDQLIGAKAGDTPEVKVTFPENYGAPHLAGKEAVFACAVKEVRKPKSAEIDDALATRFGADSLDALKQQVRERLGEEYGQASRAVLKRRLMDALDAMVSFDLPPVLVDAEAAQIAHQLWHEEHHDHQGHDHPEIEPTDEHRELAARRVRLGLLLAEIGQKAEVTVSDQELQRAIFAQARQYPGQERQFFEFVQKNPSALQQLRAPLFEDKVVDHIVEQAEVTDKPVSKEELQAAIDALGDEAATEVEVAPAD